MKKIFILNKNSNFIILISNNLSHLIYIFYVKIKKKIKKNSLMKKKKNNNFIVFSE
jgi:hypothetical protein